MAAFPVRPKESWRESMLKAEVLAEASGSQGAPACVKVPLDVCVPNETPWKILFLVAEDFSFLARRRPLARKAQEAGPEGWVMTCPRPFAEKLKPERFHVLPCHISPSRHNPPPTVP